MILEAIVPSLEDRCRFCPELLADGYGKCDHRRCMACVRTDSAIKAWCGAHEWLEDWTESLASQH